MTTSEISKHSGLTLRQLQYWDEQGILTAKHIRRERGSPSRRYTKADLVTAKRLFMLRSAGIPPRRASKLVNGPWVQVTGISTPKIFGKTLVVPHKMTFTGTKGR